MNSPSANPKPIFNTAQSNDTLENLSQRLTLALKSTGIGVWEYNIVDGTLVWDDQMYRLYGITANTFSGAYEAWEKGLHPDDLERGRNDIQDAIKGLRKFDTVFRVVWPSGEIRNISAFADVFHDKLGNPTHMYGVNSDITEQHRIQESLVQNNKDLQHFSHVAAHDLREPCRRQQALSQMILEDYADSIPPELENVVVQINQQAHHMLEIINSFRALTNIDSKPLSKTQFEMQDAVRSVLDEYSNELETVAVECDLNVTVTGYMELVHILLRNIISNAIKYGSSNMKLLFSSEIQNGKTVFVIENSSNASMDVNVDIFRLFVQNTNKKRGQGIGLSICKRVVDYHTGDIWVEPKPGFFCIKFCLGNVEND